MRKGSRSLQQSRLCFSRSFETWRRRISELGCGAGTNNDVQPELLEPLYQPFSRAFGMQSVQVIRSWIDVIDVHG